VKRRVPDVESNDCQDNGNDELNKADKGVDDIHKSLSFVYNISLGTA